MTRALRHLTVTGYLVHDRRTLLHWHQRNQLWLPFGGHIEPDEDPIQAVQREVLEESGVAAVVAPSRPAHAFRNLAELPTPLALIVAPVRSCSVAQAQGWAGPIEHIDLVYACRPRDGIGTLRVDDPSFRWLARADLEANPPVAPPGGGPPGVLTGDVRELALEALSVAGA